MGAKKKDPKLRKVQVPYQAYQWQIDALKWDAERQGMKPTAKLDFAIWNDLSEEAHMKFNPDLQ